MLLDAESVSGANSASLQLSESIDLQSLRGKTVSVTNKEARCPQHGRRYWLFKQAGPCLHPDCVTATLEFFSNTTNNSAFNNVIKLGAVDFVSWSVAEGFVFLADCWRKDEVAWLKLCKAYIDHRKVEYLKGPRMKAEIQDWILDEVSASRYSSHGTKQDYPDSTLWLKECTGFMIHAFGPALAAAILGCVEITDVARLCFNGDVFKARVEYDEALKELKRWHENKTCLN